MLHARACCTHAHAGGFRAADRSANAALDAYEYAGPIEDDLPCVYWCHLGEAHQLIGSSALNLGHPKRAVSHFLDASAAHTSQQVYNGDAFPRGHAIYLKGVAQGSELGISLVWLGFYVLSGCGWRRSRDCG
ncbi:hypothetical protein [Streptomyces sp. NPDC057253]|uniref:hypothetical protein n=1 Tax=Streptomyces sp. NPDC057253 TaxID=3346069 RepID=UPI00362D2217